MNRIILVFLVLISPLSQAIEFAEVFDMSARGFEREARITLNYQFSEIKYDLAKHEKDMRYVDERLTKIESEYSSSPVFWFVRGLHARNMVVLSLRQKNNKLQQAWQEKKQRFFAKAMTLDKSAKEHLSAAAYADMKKGLDGELKQQAIAAELKLGGNGENESYYWYLHWSNINELQKQGKIKEAEAALDKMRTELAVQGKTAEVYRQIANKAEQDIELRKKQQKANAKASREYLLPKKDQQVFTEEKLEDKYYFYLLIVIVIMMVLVVSYLLFSIKRNKS